MTAPVCGGPPALALQTRCSFAARVREAGRPTESRHSSSWAIGTAPRPSTRSSERACLRTRACWFLPGGHGEYLGEATVPLADHGHPELTARLVEQCLARPL